MPSEPHSLTETLSFVHHTKPLRSGTRLNDLWHTNSQLGRVMARNLSIYANARISATISTLHQKISFRSNNATLLDLEWCGTGRDYSRVFEPTAGWHSKYPQKRLGIFQLNFNHWSQCAFFSGFALCQPFTDWTEHDLIHLFAPFLNKWSRLV